MLSAMGWQEIGVLQDVQYGSQKYNRIIKM